MRNKIKISRIALFTLLSFILGIFFAPISIISGLFFVSLFYIFLKDRTVTVFCLVFFLAGSFYFLNSFYQIPSSLESPVIGKITEEPLYKENSARIVLERKEGKMLLYTDTLVAYEYGDVLMVDGDFVSPEKGSYANYLMKEGIYHTSFYPEMEKIGSERNFFNKALQNFRGGLKNTIRKAVPAPESFLLEAVVLGDRSSFPSELDEMLSISGTRHITAISGMHIIIISSALFFLFSFLGVLRSHAALLSLFCIFLFVIFVGAPASAVRAGVMGGLLLLSYFCFRETVSKRLIVFAAAVMLVFNPFLLHFDLGFQLSFLAVTGIAFLQGPVKVFLCGNDFLRKKEKLADILAVTLSAQLFVFPLILYNFGHIPLFSVFTNILIVPLLPFVMVFGFLTALTGAFIFSFPAYLLLSFILLVVETVAGLPFAAVYLEKVPLYFVIFLYGLIIYKTLQLSNTLPFFRKTNTESDF